MNGSTYDAIAGKQPTPHAALFHNNHDGTFTDVAAKAWLPMTAGEWLAITTTMAGPIVRYFGWSLSLSLSLFLFFFFFFLAHGGNRPRGPHITLKPRNWQVEKATAAVPGIGGLSRS